MYLFCILILICIATFPLRGKGITMFGVFVTKFFTIASVLCLTRELLAEYGMGNEVTTSGDVYSYGILLLEMFTGRRPTDNKFSNSLSIHNFVKMALLEQNIEGIADPTLLQQREKAGESSSKSTNRHQDLASKSQDISECLISILQIGITCSEELPRDRIAISDAVSQLLAVRNTHFGGASGALPR